MFTRHQRSEQALILSLMEMVVGGVSTRKITQITEELCGTEFSKSTVSERCKRLDSIVTGWNNRPLSDDEFPFVLVDALYLVRVTQTELAGKYGVSSGGISSRFLAIEDKLLDELIELEIHLDRQMEKQTDPHPFMVSRRLMADLRHALLEHKFESEKGLQQSIRSFNVGEQSTSKPQLNRARAQDMLYDAWDSASRVERIRLAKQALKLYKHSADAYVILAQDAATDVREMREYYTKGVIAGERDLGPDYFKENKGHFWGIIETRPYMRAKQGLAERCWEMGDHEEALQHYRDMLVLNPGDNQGIRYDLLCALLEIRQYDEAEELLEIYDENWGHMAYNRVLVTYAKSGLTKEVDKLLQKAVAANPYAPAYLLGKRALPDERPKYIGFGDELEVIGYAFDHMSSWWREKELLRRLNQLDVQK